MIYYQEKCSTKQDIESFSIKTQKNLEYLRSIKERYANRNHHHHHHASLLKIINKTGSLFRGLGALRLFSLSLSLSLALVLCSLRALHCHRS